MMPDRHDKSSGYVASLTHYLNLLATTKSLLERRVSVLHLFAPGVIIVRLMAGVSYRKEFDGDAEFPVLVKKLLSRFLLSVVLYRFVQCVSSQI